MPSPYLTYLVPKTGLAAWYPLDNDSVGGTTISDESGNGRNLDSGLFLNNLLLANQLNARKAVVHNNNHPLTYSTPLSGIKDALVIGKVDHASTFPATYGGMLSGVLAASYPVLVGSPSTTRWLSTAEGTPAFNYYKSGTVFASGSRSAPFSYFEQMRVSGNFDLDGIQFGRDRDFGTRLFQGKWADALFYTTALTDNYVARLKLYGDLKFGLWRLNGTTLNFPDPSLTDIAYRYFKEVPYKWDDAVVTHEYEDMGRSFNEVTDTPPREWIVEMDCVAGTHALAKEQFDVFDAFWNAARTSRPFSFLDKYGTTHTNVRIKSYSRDHSGHRSWLNEVVFNLVKYP